MIDSFFSIVLCFLSSDSSIQLVWVGSYDFGFRFLVIPSCDCLCSLLFIAPGWWKFRRLYTAYFQWINIAINHLLCLRQMNFNLYGHREIVISARLLVMILQTLIDKYT